MTGSNWPAGTAPWSRLVTEPFWPQGDLIALSNGMPDVPRLRLPHPVAGSGAEAMARLAATLAPRIIAVLRGEARRRQRAGGGGRDMSVLHAVDEADGPRSSCTGSAAPTGCRS